MRKLSNEQAFLQGLVIRRFYHMPPLKEWTRADMEIVLQCIILKLMQTDQGGNLRKILCLFQQRRVRIALNTAPSRTCKPTQTLQEDRGMSLKNKLMLQTQWTEHKTSVMLEVELDQSITSWKNSSHQPKCSRVAKNQLT